jgi:deoxyribonuclease-4
MPYFGAHLSIAGGLHKALEAACAYGFQSVQLFTKSANQWQARPLGAEEIHRFRQTLRRCRLHWPTAHNSYLINLASPDPALYRKSLEALVVEVQRAEQLGLRYLVMHPGSTRGTEEAAGLARVAAALDEVHARCPGYRVRILLETTAGQGGCLGHRFEHLADILTRVQQPERLGICFDTCHVFAAGYPLAPAENYETTMRTFDKIIGLKWLRCFHLNDSQKPLGSRIDRHAHLGRGHLGLEPFRLLVNDPRFRRHPMLLETPKEGPEPDMDAVNLAVLRSLVGRRQPLESFPE